MSNPTKPAYFMVQIKFKNFEESMQRYGMPAIPTLSKFGGEMIAGSRTPKVLEGSWDGNWAAVLRFPSMEAAEGWYHSSDYKALKELRLNELTDEGGWVLAIEALEPATLGG